MASIPRGEERYDSARAIQLAMVAALGGFLFGFDTAVINGAVTALREDFGIGAGPHRLRRSPRHCSARRWARGAPVAWPTATDGSRSWSPRPCCSSSARSASGLASGPRSLISGRVVGGLGVGAASVIAPAYIAEISPATIRGRLGSLQQLAIVIGIFVALLIDALLAARRRWRRRGPRGWGSRPGGGCSSAVALPGAGLRRAVAHDPRVAAPPRGKGQLDEARRSWPRCSTAGVGRAHRGDRATPSPRRSAPSPASPTCAVRRSACKPIVWVGILLSVFQQAVGINVIFYYSSALWQQVGLQRGRCPDHHRPHFGHQHPRDAGRHRDHRPRGAACPAADRLRGNDRQPRNPGRGLRHRACGRTASPRSVAAPGSSPSSPPTCSSSSSVSPGARWFGCCSARCSTTASAPLPSAWPRRRSG